MGKGIQFIDLKSDGVHREEKKELLSGPFMEVGTWAHSRWSLIFALAVPYTTKRMEQWLLHPCTQYRAESQQPCGQPWLFWAAAVTTATVSFCSHVGFRISEMIYKEPWEMSSSLKSSQDIKVKETSACVCVCVCTCFILANSLRVCSSFLRSFLFPTRMMGTLGQKCFTSGVHFSGIFSVPEGEEEEEAGGGDVS